MNSTVGKYVTLEGDFISVGDDSRATQVDPQIGERMPDETIYAGISPDTGKSMYALPADAPLTMKWEAAMEYAANFEGLGHPKAAFRLPTHAELDVLYQNRDKGALKGTFNESGFNSGWYWSSTEKRDYVDAAWGQRFSGGNRVWYLKSSNESSLRLVRG